MDLILAYGALFLGVILEGELAILAAGVASQEGLFDIYLVGIIAFFGTVLTDWSWFLIGKYAGTWAQLKFKFLEKHATQSKRLIHKYPYMIVFLYRYLYGFRIATLIYLGITGFPPKRYFILSLFSILVWTVVFTFVSFYFGEMMISLLHTNQFWGYLLAGVAFLLIAIYLLRKVPVSRYEFFKKGSSEN